MVRRLFAVGAAIALIFVLSVSSFAVDEPSYYNYGFPYFTCVRLTQGSSTLVAKTLFNDDGRYVKGSYSSSFSNSTSGTVNMYLYPDIPDEVTTMFHCNQILGGSYSIDGYLEFSSSSDITSSDFSLPSVQISDGNNIVVGDFDVVSFEYRVVNGTNNKRVHYSFVFDVPSTIRPYSYIRFQVPISGNHPCIGWSIYTGAVDIFEHNISSDSQINYNTNLFSRLINFLGTGFGRIVDAVKDDSDAQQAAQSADHQAITEASSEISAVEQYESTVSGSIDDSIDDIRDEGFLTPPSGFGSSVGVIGYVFTSFYNCLGTYKFIVVVPLVLGLVLLLVGRGGRALRKDN